MLRKLFGCLATFVLSLSLTTATAVPLVQAQNAASEQFIELLEEGLRLERANRWQEAIQQYEKLQRKFPDRHEVDHRLKVTRIHYDVNRRYADRSFHETITQTTPHRSLELLSEVSNKLQLYYVEPINFANLLRNGTAFLEVALTEESFLKSNVSPSVKRETIEHFRNNIHKSVLGKPANSIHDARNIVTQVSTMAYNQLGIPPSAVIFEYVAGFVGLLDPYSAYLTAGEYQEIMSQIEGNLIGIGVELWAEGNDLRIVDVFRGGPAAEAGLTRGDELLVIDGSRVDEIGAKRAADLLRGPESSHVVIQYRSGEGAIRDLTIRRRRVEVPSVSAASIVDRDNGIGYLRISNFQKTTSREVDEALRSLFAQGLQSLIIDLRRNPGGLLDAAVEIADKFIPSGAIVTTRGRNGHENHNYVAHVPGTFDIPLTVIIDEDSASASEIFAGAIRDQNRGLIVGRTSYGKGSVQGVFHNDQSGGGLRLTVSKFFSPNGTAISTRGIQPHIHFESEPKAAERAKQVVSTITNNPNSLAGGAPFDRTASVEVRMKPEMNERTSLMQDQDILRAIDSTKSVLARKSIPTSGRISSK